MSIKVLNLSNLQEREENFDDFDLQTIGGAGCIPYVIKWQMAGRRLGTAKTKLLSEISGSTVKIIRQKGSGRARHGAKRATQFVGGRTCFGPQPRDFSFSIPKKIVKKALNYVLLSKIKDNKLILVEGMDDFKISTNELNKKLKSKSIDNAVFAYEDVYENFMKSLRNLYKYKALNSNALNVYDLLHYDFLLLDIKSFNKIKEAL